MDHGDFEIPEYDELDKKKTTSDEGKSVLANKNDSYRLPTRTSGNNLKKKYEEHVQATLDYAADRAESNIQSKNPSERPSEEDAVNETAVDYEEIYRSALTTTDARVAGQGLDHVAVAYNAQRSKEIDEAVSRAAETTAEDAVHDPGELDESIRWVTLEPTQDPKTKGPKRVSKGKRKVKSKRGKRGGRGDKEM